MKWKMKKKKTENVITKVLLHISKIEMGAVKWNFY